jgi:iron complex outermembrane receptor protein
VARQALRFVALAAAWSFSAAAAAQTTDDERALRQMYGDEDLVSIATGDRRPVGEAPAVTSVITAADIRAMGATNVDEVLETIPGLHVDTIGENYTTTYTFRGIYAQTNTQVLVMVNGVPITDVYTGGRSYYWGGMPVEAISRIEVVRGPGSALYGASAAAGVINIITRSAGEIGALQAGGRAGSFETYDAWLLHGGTWGGFDVAAAFEFRDTAGQRRTIDVDAQTGLDEAFGSHASRAPGRVDTMHRNYDGRLEVSRGGFRLRGGMQLRRNIGLGAGITGALSPESRYRAERWSGDLTYQTDVGERGHVEAQVSYLGLADVHSTDIYLFPKGTVLPIGNNGQIDPVNTVTIKTFPDGYIGNPDVWSHTVTASLSGSYRPVEALRLRGGAGASQVEVNIAESKNFGLDPATGLPLSPTGGVVDVTGTRFAFIQGRPSRTDLFAYAQGELTVLRDWTLTAGARYDRFSDIGHTFNPRGGLVWDARRDLTIKAMYGTAFRPPTFQEMYFVNAPFTISNRNLTPERFRTAELAFEYRPLDTLRLGANVFRYWWRSIIGWVPLPDSVVSEARNVGSQNGYGGELELAWKLGPVRLVGNYAYQRSTDELLDADAGLAPHHQAYGRVQWAFWPGWHVVPQAKWIGARSRTAGDDRPRVPNYTAVDLTLRRSGLWDHVEVAVSVRNLLDADIREPTPVGGIPHDLPLAGRSYFGEVRVGF